MSVCLDCKRKLKDRKSKRCQRCYRLHDDQLYMEMHRMNASLKLHYKVPNMNPKEKRYKGSPSGIRSTAKIMHDDSLKYVTSKIYTK